ncbi:hypothetical protein PP178_03920 [Zeaxanthinibacter sp. PT1]|uniref:hypothetical protein n=1 Tax=Zeaxanthinibacter TaxID=561554 RepID=UPI002349C491|nr:hypothetical protein [Zeaxanthinibacter sp. PT1]MDC6350687.1 hypothetical protein [Zeaxanthinibacter sp. PT1]
MSKQLFIVNVDGDATNKTATSFADVRAGKLGFVEGGAVIASLTGGEAQIAVDDEISTPFTGVEVQDAVKQAPFAGTAQQATIDFTGAAAGEPLYVKLIDTTIGTMDVEIKSYERATLQGIVDAINADGAKSGSKFEGFSAALAASVITVTAPVNKTFRVSATDGCTLDQLAVKPVPTRGQDEDLKKLEVECLPSRGIHNNVGFPVVKPDSKVVAGATYVLYVYDIARGVPNKAGTGTAAIEDNQIIVAVKSDLANTIAALDGDAIAE